MGMSAAVLKCCHLTSVTAQEMVVPCETKNIFCTNVYTAVFYGTLFCGHSQRLSEKGRKLKRSGANGPGAGRPVCDGCRKRFSG